MINIHFKDTTININCNSIDDLYSLYHNLSYKYTFIINDEEIAKTGPVESKNKNIKAYFAGYTKEYFKNKFEKYIDTPKIGDEVYIHGYIDEIRKDNIIIRNNGGYFGTVENEIIKK